MIYHRDNLYAMNGSKSENSSSPSNLTDRAAREKVLAKKITHNYESTTFSNPILDQFRGLMPDFNKRLSPERDLRLSAGNLRLSSDTPPRLISSSISGIRFTALPECILEVQRTPSGKRLEIMPDLPGRTLAGERICSLLHADLPMTPLASRYLTPSKTENKPQEIKKDRE